MSRQPRARVAVITRTKDRPVFLKRAIESVLLQTFEDWLHVIVNDGGDSKTVDFLVSCEAESYQGRVLVIHHAESQGMQNASNAGIYASSSDYVVIHDDDDSWKPKFLEKTVEALDNEYDRCDLTRAVATQSTQIFEEVQFDGQIVETSRRQYSPFSNVTLGDLLRGNRFPPIALLYRRDIHEKVGLFRQDFDVLGDYDFNLRLSRHFDILVLDEVLANYHWRQRSFGNTVTHGRSIHRSMLAKMKNAYARDVLDRLPDAIGLLDQVPMPPAAIPSNLPYNLGRDEPHYKYKLPDFEASYDFEVLSLDIFDTVLFRRTYRPIDVFKLLEEKAVEQLALPSAPYALARKKAENKARESANGGEVSIKQIYQFLGELLELSADQLSILQALEWSIEKKLLYVDPRWLQFYQQYQEKGKRIIFITDMYWPKNDLTNLLVEFGFRDPDIFVSCDYGLSKHDGALQPEIIQALGLHPSEILHIGDNYRSDVAQSRNAGMQAYHWGQPHIYKPLVEQVEFPPLLDEDPFSLRLMGEARYMELVKPLELSADPLMEGLGRELAGPLYYCFISWLVQIARKDGIHNLVFIGRDGYYWEKTMQFLDEKHNLGLEFSYLHASRKIFAFASFRKLDARAIEFLSVPNPSLRVRDFIDRAGLDCMQYLDSIQSVGFSSLNEVLTSELGGSFLREDYKGRLVRLFYLIELDLLESFRRCREGLLQSLDEKSFDVEDSAIVDIGWQGSSAHALAHLLNLHETKSLKAYYFGTWHCINDISASVCSRSFFVHAGEPKELGNLVSESVSVLEALHSAPFPTMLDYVFQEQEGYMPVFSTGEISGLTKAEQEHVWKGVKIFLETVSDAKFPLSSKDSGINYLERVLHRLLREPSPLERSRLGKVLHSEGFGVEINKPLIAQMDKKVKTDDFMKKYRLSSWKIGFLAELSGTTRGLVLAHLRGDINLNTISNGDTINSLSEATRGLVLAHFRGDKNSPYYKKTPWHKHIYRWYRRILGDPKYIKTI